MGIGPLRAFLGEWELAVDLPGAESARGHVLFEAMGEILVQRTIAPVPEAPDSCCMVITKDDNYVQHYFDARGVARIYAMTFDGRTWTLERTKPDMSPLEFHQQFIGTIRDDGAAIEAEWQISDDGRRWRRDFGLTYKRILPAA